MKRCACELVLQWKTWFVFEPKFILNRICMCCHESRLENVYVVLTKKKKKNWNRNLGWYDFYKSWQLSVPYFYISTPQCLHSNCGKKAQLMHIAGYFLTSTSRINFNASQMNILSKPALAVQMCKQGQTLHHNSYQQRAWQATTSLFDNSAVPTRMN